MNYYMNLESFTKQFGQASYLIVSITYANGAAVDTASTTLPKEVFGDFISELEHQITNQGWVSLWQKERNMLVGIPCKNIIKIAIGTTQS